MARPLRIEYPDAIYHIVSRGNKRSAVFLDDHDKDAFLDLLLSVKDKYNFICHAYSLMDNHYHLVIETPDANLSKGIRQLNGVYTQMFNKKHKSVGHVFQGRYKAILVQKDTHLLELIRYIVLNPVRANIVSLPNDYVWSSYLSDKRPTHPSVTYEWTLSLFGKYRKTALKKYHRFIMDGIDNDSPKVTNSLFIGDTDFVKQITEQINNASEIKEIPKYHRYASRPKLKELFSNSTISKDKRDNIIREAVLTWGYTQKEIAAELSIHYSTVSVIVNKIQE